MYTLIQNSYFGRLVYLYSNYKYFKHEEDQDDYEVPEQYLDMKDKQIILEWEPNDPNHPKNWSQSIKIIIQSQMLLLTFAMYMGGPVITPAAETIEAEFSITYIYTTFPLCFYILGYGFSQMFFSPMSEQANIGRTPVYFYTGILFCILQIPCALSTNITGLTISRLLAGFFASPALSVGAATFTDVVHLPYVPVALALWGLAAFCGPSIGPIIGVGLMIKSWPYIFWFLLALAGAVTLILFLSSPETNEKSLLLWKAQRLRRVTGNPNIVTQSELDQVSLREFYSEMLKRAFKIMILEPIVLLMDIYQGMCYGLLYLWFECFPVAYGETYHFSTAALALAYNCINVGVVIGVVIYVAITNQTFTKKALNNEPIRAESFLLTSFLGSVMVTISLFIFGWTISPDIHWFPSLVAATIFGAGCVCVLQSNLNYLGMLYPRYVASVFGGNGLFRSLVGGTFPLYGKQMFNNLSVDKFPVAWGCTLLGFIFLLMTLIPVLFYKYGPKLQSRSSYAN